MPDPPEGFKGKRDGRTRRERFEADEDSGTDRPQLNAPLLDPRAAHLIQHLFEVGPSSGAGEVVSWQEIEAWAGMTGTDLDPWGAGIVRRLSVEFVNERHKATDPNRPAPGAAPVLSVNQRTQISVAREAYWDRMIAQEGAAAPKVGRAPTARRQRL